MLCQNCHERAANVHFTKIVNGKKVEMYLCEQCAKEKGQFGFVSSFDVSDFLSSLMGFESNAPYMQAVQQKQVCPKCGMSFEEFQSSGKLGCANCYELFQNRLDPLLKRLHGSTRHHGKVPGTIEKERNKSMEIERLREQLNEAIKNEEYEKAAQIRDEIRLLESGQ